MLTILVFTLFTNCVSRYIFNIPLPWAEEFAVYCYVWLAFIGAACAFNQKSHLKMEVLSEKMSVKTKKWLQIFIFFFIEILLIFLIVQGFKAMSLQRAKYTIALPIRISSMYFFAFPLVLSSVSMLITGIFFILEILNDIKKEIKI
jgi:TRAP-type C4-dicarboxylate transport system permease small subunit